MNKPTRRQHTVWRKYLRAWATNDQICCAMAGKSFSASLMKIGQERDFYRMHEMTEADIALIRATFIAPMGNPLLREMSEQWIGVFDHIRKMRLLAEQLGIDASSALEDTYIQGEESLQSSIEQNAIHLLDRLLAEDDFCLVETSDYGIFMHFMMTQYFRTSRMLENLRRGMGDRFGGTLERSMGLMRHMFASTAGFTLLAEREVMKSYLLVNDSGVPFITGDQPVINVMAVDLPDDKAVDDCEFYYPLSPRKALFIAKRSDYSSGKVSEAQAREFNRLIAVAAEKQIYGETLSDLDDVLHLVGRHLAPN